MVNPFVVLMTQTLTLERRTGVDNYGAAVYAAGVTVACRHVVKPTRVQTDTGVMIVGQDTVRCPPDTGLKADDRVTLPDGRVVLLKTAQNARGPFGEVWAEHAVCL